MREEDSDNINRLIRARILRALHRLDRLVRGAERGLKSDHQLRACIALVRLAPQMLGRPAPEEEQDEYAELHRRIAEDPERELAGRQLNYLRSLTPEQAEEFSARREAAIAEWEKSLPPPGTDRMEYYKTHPIKHISEVEDEQWPPHLRKSSLKTKEDTDE